MNVDKPNTADTLRKRAEALLAKAPESFQPEDLKDVHRLAHELAVHQAELELQNEELRDTQLALQQTRDRFASLFDHAPVGYVVLDASGIIRQTNATWGEMVRQPDEDFRGRAFAEALADEDASIFLTRFRAFFRNPDSKQIEARIKRRGAPPFFARIEAQPRAAKDDSASELMVIVSDISDLQKARVEVENRNAELAASNERLHHIYRVLLGIRNVNQLIVSEDDPRRLIERACANLTETMGYHNAWIALVGGEAARRLGLPDEGPVAAAASAGFGDGFEVLRERLMAGEFPECMNRALEPGKAFVKTDPAADCLDCPLHGAYGGRTGLARRLAFDGVTYGILTASVPAAFADDAEEQDLFNEVASDLAFALHKIAAARRQKQSDQRLSLVIEGSGLGTWEWNVRTNKTIFNEQWATMIGYALDELAPHNYETWERLVHPEDIERARLAVTDCVEGRTPDYECEFRMRHKDGHWVWILDRGRVMTRDADGKPLAMFGTHTDITRIKDAVQALQESEQRIQSIFRSAPIGIGVVTDRVIREANPKMCEITGYSAEEMIGRSARMLYPSDEDFKYVGREKYRQITERSAGSVETRWKRKDGAIIDVLLSSTPIDTSDLSKGVTFTSLDITEHRQAEDALRESESRVRRKLNALLDPEGDIGMLHLADLVDCDQIQSLMNDFYALTTIGVGILDLEGNVLVRTGWQDVCTKFHRVHPETARNCIESDTLLASGVEPGTFMVYKCKNNMWDMVTPIMIGERHLGNLFLGQFFFEDEAPNIDVFREQARRYGFDEEAYLKAYQSIPRWSRQTVDAVMTFYCNLIGVISRLSYAHIKLARTSESLRQSEQRFRSFVENANDMVYALSPEGVFTYISPNWLDFMGEPPEQTIGKSFEPYVHPEDVHLFRAFLEKTLTTGEKQSGVEYRVRHRDGSWRWLVSNGSPIRDETGTVTGYTGIARDMTEEKRIKEALVQSEKNYRDIFDNSSDCIFIHDAATGAIVDVNRTTCETFGYSVEEIKRLNVGDFSLNQPPYTNTEALEWIRKAYMEGPQRFEWLAKDRKGRLIWLENTLLYAQIGGKDRVLVFGSNIDDRKHAEIEIRKSEELLNQAQEIAQLGSYVWNIGDDSLEWSRQMFVIAGLDPDGFYGNLSETISNMIHPEDRADVIEQVQKMVEQKRTWPMEFRLVRPDGGVRWLSSTSRFQYDDKGDPVLCVGVHHDITEKKQRDAENESLQSQLHQAQKMEAVGRLAGGVAHDFNNMLGIIIGHTDMILEEMGPEHPFYADLLEIKKAAARSADLTRQLLAFARKQTVAPKVIDLNKTVEGMLKMLQRLIGEDIDMEWIPAENAWPVKIDPGQIDQILVNLCVNARDAIADVGKVTIETGNIVFDEDYCKVHNGFVPGEYTMLAVSDNGCGMDSVTLSHAFEPFFTTKEPGKGTGLGLATVYGVVKQNDGFINVYSEPGQGTTFKIYLPRYKAKAAPLSEKGSDISSGRGHETILLVEDEPAILRMATMMLGREGYTVLGAGTPGEAVRLATEHPGDIHLLITDVVMPEMNGRDLAKNILSLYPGLKCLFMSGYTANVIAHHGILDEGVQFIQKPFSKQALTAKVRELLDEAK